jgi:hypothetical protein
MRTKTLIMWSLVCGVVILAAGGFKLLQIAADDATVEFLAAGVEAEVGGATVAAVSLRDEPGATYVTVSMAGVDAGDAVASWRLLALGVVHQPGSVAAADGGPCAATVQSSATCVLEFPATEGVRTVAFLRGGVQRQWTLSP